jgi:tetratricopeptide (TPR) repeat protein
MNLERLKLLEQYAREDPNDPFPVYALALEFMKSDPQKAKDLFDKLLTDHPDYLPAYYHAGYLYFTNGDLATAKRILETGAQKLKTSGDMKTLNEIRGLLEGIGD